MVDQVGQAVEGHEAAVDLAVTGGAQDVDVAWMGHDGDPFGNAEAMDRGGRRRVRGGRRVGGVDGSERADGQEAGGPQGKGDPPEVAAKDGRSSNSLSWVVGGGVSIRQLAVDFLEQADRPAREGCLPWSWRSAASAVPAGCWAWPAEVGSGAVEAPGTAGLSGWPGSGSAGCPGRRWARPRPAVPLPDPPLLPAVPAGRRDGRQRRQRRRTGRSDQGQPEQGGSEAERGAN